MGTLTLFTEEKYKMSPQEFVDLQYDDLVRYLARAADHADHERDIAMAVCYGAAHAAWTNLNESIIKYGFLPSKWKKAT